MLYVLSQIHPSDSSTQTVGIILTHILGHNLILYLQKEKQRTDILCQTFCVGYN